MSSHPIEPGSEINLEEACELINSLEDRLVEALAERDELRERLRRLDEFLDAEEKKDIATERTASSDDDASDPDPGS